MSQLASEEEIALAVKHLMQTDNGLNTEFLKSAAKHLIANQTSLNNNFTNSLKWLVKHYQEPKEPSPISDVGLKSLKLQRILKEICHQPEIDLTYQGVNLGTAINMKLAVNLANLIKEEKV